MKAPPGCAGQTVSAYFQVKMEDAPRLPKIPKSECPEYTYIETQNAQNCAVFIEQDYHGNGGQK